MIRPDQAGETIKILNNEPQRDEYGALIGYTIKREIPHCIVSPDGDSIVEGTGFIHGDITKYQVLAPPGTTVHEGEKIEIRGELFTVDFTPFDYSHARRPIVRLHTPKTRFTVSRGETHDHIS